MASSRSALPQEAYHGRYQRQEIHSSSSTRSTSSSKGPGRANSHPPVESAVTRLLVAIKQLLESLTLWSTLQMTEAQVSDVYVRLGNDFNLAVAAFGSFHIDMSDLMSVPDDLREVLEPCLAEDANADNLATYLPSVRQIITNLLQGLRVKQSMYRKIIAEHRTRAEQRSEQGGHSRTESNFSRAEKSSLRREGDTRHRSQPSRNRIEEEPADVNEQNVEAKTIPPPASKLEDLTTSVPEEPLRNETSSPQFDRRYMDRNLNGQVDRASLPPQTKTPAQSPAPISSSYPLTRSTLASASAETLVPPTMSNSSNPPNFDKEMPSPPQPTIPPSIKRYSLVDKPMTLPAVLVQEDNAMNLEANSEQIDSPPPPEPSTPDTSSAPAPPPAAEANLLAALQRSETLERRASKRFSTYNISKMTGTHTARDRPGRNNGTPNRRSMAVSSALTPGELDVLTEVDEPQESLRREGSSRSRRAYPNPRTPSPAVERDITPPVPPLPALPSSEAGPSAGPNGVPRDKSPEEKPSSERLSEQASQPRSHYPVFLQLGREVKRVTIEPQLSFSSLRMLFVDKFAYNPGMDNFPAIYIRDPSSGVQYELENVDEVKEKCLLSLNIEPLDQIKQHIDAQISSLSQEIKELKSAVSVNRRASHIPVVLPDYVESTPKTDRPSEKQFRHVARRVSLIVGDSLSAASPFIQPHMTGQSLQLQPQFTGTSTLSEYSTRVVEDLKTQFDEVQNLRIDLGVMRQLYTDFMKQTKESLGVLRTQTHSVKQLANAKIGGARAFINSGKMSLDTRSQDVLTKVEELQDNVEALKDDVIKRQAMPKSSLLKTVQADIASTAAELQSLDAHIKTIKPMWKKTWEEELQNIVEEQQFLGHQEEFLSDLIDDHKAVMEVMGQLEKVITIRGAAPGRGIRNRGIKASSEDDGGDLTSVMMEIRGASVDPERRMKAIAASQKHREKELASRPDEFHAELSNFVGAKKLKMTGGAEEVERVRQRRNEMTIKAMFSDTQSMPSPSLLIDSGNNVSNVP